MCDQVAAATPAGVTRAPVGTAALATGPGVAAANVIQTEAAAKETVRADQCVIGDGPFCRTRGTEKPVCLNGRVSRTVMPTPQSPERKRRRPRHAPAQPLTVYGALRLVHRGSVPDHPKGMNPRVADTIHLCCSKDLLPRAAATSVFGLFLQPAGLLGSAVAGLAFGHSTGRGGAEEVSARSRSRADT